MKNQETAKKPNPRRDRLNQLGEAWCAADVSPTERDRLKNEIFTLVMEIFQKKYVKNTEVCFLEGIVDFLDKDWEEFDAAQGTLYSFVWKRLKNHAVDIYRKEARRNGRNVSLDAAAYGGGEEDGTTRLETLEGAADEYPELSAELETELLALAVRFPERLHGHAKNPEKLNYYRMFLTDNVSKGLRDMTLRVDRIKNEKELLDAMKTEFLDYYKLRACRTAAEIRDCPLKTWGELVSGRPAEEPDQPLPNDVYLAYLNEREGKALKSESTITNQRTAYRAFQREILGDYLN